MEREGAAAQAKPPRSPRDVRLDFFRGLAMFIIFIAHMPDNPWFEWIPARFGFSSAAELFVFCSGLASSFAFGALFVKRGFVLGSARVAFRIWQVYWSHIGLALVMIIASVAGAALTGMPYAQNLGLGWFLANPGEGLLRLMTLTFTPNFLDILPMYLVLLFAIPLVMALAKVSPKLVLGLMLALWLLVRATGLNLPGGTEPGMAWFFNPLAWQIVFFTGFSFGMGWLPTPRLHTGLLFKLCVAVLVLSVPVNFWGFTNHVTFFETIRIALEPYVAKTNQPPLLFLHFLASAYVALVLIERVRDRLHRATFVVAVGQQALGAFMASLVLAWVGGMVLDQTGRGFLAVALVNLAGLAGVWLAAKIAAYFKGSPWNKPPAGRKEGAAAPEGARVAAE